MDFKDLKTQCKVVSIKPRSNEIEKLYNMIVRLEEQYSLNKSGFGWKGKSGVEIKKVGNEYFVTEHRKAKISGKISKEVHIVTKESVNMILSMIKKTMDEEGVTNYRQVVTALIGVMNLKVGIDAFNGGYNRSKYFFKYYYYQVKVLEYYKFIEYGGKGKITLLKNEDFDK